MRLEAIRRLPAVFKLLWESSPGLVSGMYAARFVAAMVPAAIVALSRLIVDAVSGAATSHAAPTRLWWLVGAECGLAVLFAVLGRTSSWLETLVADRFTFTLSLRVMQHAARLDLSAYEDPQFQDRLERARVQATDRIRLVRAVGELIQQSILVIGFGGMLAAYSPWLAVVLVACIIPAVIGESHFTFKGYALNFAQTPRRREIDYLRELVTTPESAKEVRLFGLAGHFTTRFEGLWRALYAENATLARRRWAGGTLLAALIVAGYYSCYVWAVWRAAEGAISVGTMVLLTGSIAGTSANFQAAFATISGLADEALYLGDLVAFFQQQPRLSAPERPVPMPRPIKEGFRFENVSFRYPGGSTDVIDRLSAHFRPGERLALVGENGHGKSTLVKLMTRLYDPTGGRILLDGVDLRDYQPEELAREMAVIFQDFMKYDLTALDNIGLGSVAAAHDAAQHDRITQAADLSRALPVIHELPRQFDQMLGRRFESGVDLSGGQWQKIALARAYVRNAQVMILDEPTASLDPQSEREVFDRLEMIARDRLTILISHRFSTVRLAERIIVIESGRIIEDGTHEGLMERAGRYATLFTLQAEHYK